MVATATHLPASDVYLYLRLAELVACAYARDCGWSNRKITAALRGVRS